MLPPKDVVPVVGLFSEIIVPTHEQKNAYLERVAVGRSLHGAASDLGLPYMSVVRERRVDAAFESDVQLALAARAGALLEIALEQCTVGVDEVLTHQGRVSYEYPNGYELDESGQPKPDTPRVPVTVKKLVTSNATLIKLLTALYPEQFKERSEVSVQGGKRVIDAVPDRITNQTDREKLIALLSKRAASRADPDEDLI
jgi:hypothetical protein